MLSRSPLGIEHIDIINYKTKQKTHYSNKYYYRYDCIDITFTAGSFGEGVDLNLSGIDLDKEVVQLGDDLCSLLLLVSGEAKVIGHLLGIGFVEALRYVNGDLG